MITKKIVEAIEQKIYDDNKNGLCCLCGNEKSFEFKFRKDIISNSFTNQNLMKARHSQEVCGYCVKLLSGLYLDSPKGGRCGIRLYSFLIEENKFKIIQKSERESCLFDYEFKLPFILCCVNS